MPTYDANVDAIQGDSVFVFTGETGAELPTAYATSCNLSVSKETIDTSNKMTGGWASSLSGRKGWTASSDCLLTKQSGLNSFDSLYDAMLSATPVSVTVGKVTSVYGLEAGWYSGKAHITALEMTAEQNGVASCTVTFTGTGALTKVVAPVIP